MKYCPKCGSEVKNNTKFCQKCGAKFPIDHIKLNNEYCKHLFSFLIPLAAIVAGIYLLTQKNEDVHKHGTCIIIIAIGVMCISYLYYIKFL